MTFKKAIGILPLVFVLFQANSAVTNSDTIAQETPDTTMFKLQADDPILVQLERLLSIPFEERNSGLFDAEKGNIHGFQEDSIPFYTDSIIYSRLQLLNEQTPFNLVFNNNVKAFINLYAVKRRELTERFLGLSHLYFPLFEELLDKHDLPLELKYLAVVESALNPRAKSRAGATGLWQFMYQTGKIYNLNVSTYVDDRQDPIKATEAACKYFKYLYGIYGNWELVLAAYNCGPGNVNKAIRKAGGPRDFWEIFKYLPRETRGYVPAFIAVNYVMNYSAEYNLYPIKPNLIFHDYDTVHVNTSLYFDQIAVTLEIPIEVLEDLNPQYKRNIIPYTRQSQVLRLPKDKVGLFVINEELIQAYKIPEYKIQEIATPEKELVHVVRSGEYLGKIASAYGVSVKSLMEWNNLKSANLRIGQRLLVYAPDKPKPQTIQASNTSSNASNESNSDSGQYQYYKVKAGDTLWDIAKAHNVSVSSLEKLNKHLDFRRLKPGDRIILSKEG